MVRHCAISGGTKFKHSRNYYVREKNGNGFRYTNANGKPVTNGALLNEIKNKMGDRLIDLVLYDQSSNTQLHDIYTCPQWWLE
jgi:hypothetical protein